MILTMYDGSNQEITRKELNSIPVQRNYKTNVTGSMVTVSGVYTATLTPEFTNPDISKEIKEVASVSEVADALKPVIM